MNRSEELLKNYERMGGYPKDVKDFIKKFPLLIESIRTEMKKELYKWIEENWNEWYEDPTDQFEELKQKLKEL